MNVFSPKSAPPVAPSARSIPRLPVLLLAACAFAVNAMPVHADDDDDDDGPRGRYCTATTNLLYAACGAEALDDFLIAKARCVNVDDAADRRDCLREARAERSAAGLACRTGRDWRKQACAVLGEARYDPDFSPGRFDDDFRALSKPNPYFPLAIGNKWEYRGGDEVNTVEVLDQTKLVEGVRCIVVRDLVLEDGKLKEDTDDWFAAARDGGTWYCGEEVKDYESFDGDVPDLPELVSIDGSFKHGRDGAKAGLIMPASPRAGMAYREEFSLGNAEDVSEILSATYSYGASAALDRDVPRALAEQLCAGDCVVTKTYSLLEPGVSARKYFARGIGFFLEIKPDRGVAVQLVGCNFDARCAGLPAP